METFKQGDLVSVSPYDDDFFFPFVGVIVSSTVDAGRVLYLVSCCEGDVYTVVEEQLEFAEPREEQ